MKNKFIVKLPFILMALVVTFFSCEKELNELVVQTEASTETSEEFSVSDGHLVFSSTESFTNTVNTISAFSKEERLNWENQNGFLSQKTIIDMVIDGEIASYDAIKEKFKGKKIEEINKRDLHSGIYNEYLDKGIIKLIDEGTKDEYWNHSAFSPVYLGFINEKGFYAIGDTLFQVTEKGLTAFINNKPEIIKDNSSKAYSNVIWSTWEGTSSNRAIMGLNIEILEYNLFPMNHYNFWHQLLIYTQQRTWYGAWMYVNRDVDFYGSWGIESFHNGVYFIGNTEGYQGFASQHMIGMNPLTGTLTTPGYIFSMWSINESTLDYMYQPYYVHYSMNVSVHVNTPTNCFDIKLNLTKN